MRKYLFGAFILFLHSTYGQKSNSDGETRVRIIQRDTSEIPLATYKKHSNQHSSLEYMHNIGFLFTSQFNGGGYADFSYDISYLSRFNLLNADDFFSVSLALSNSIGFTSTRSGFPIGFSFNYQGMVGPCFTLGLGASSNSSDMFGVSLTPTAGLFYYSNSSDQVRVGLGGNIDINYETWWDNPSTFSFFYLRDITSSIGGHIIGIKGGFYIGDF